MAAFILDDHHQNPNLKHFCKICKKGFGCGRALGGHMRAHGIGIAIADDPTTAAPLDDDDDDPPTDWYDKPTNPNRRMYALRTNPNRLKSCRVCENCGKEFLSWKSFLEHGKCATSDDLDSLLSSEHVSSPPCSEEELEDADENEDEYEDDDCTAPGRRGGNNNNNNNNNGNWSKRKRSLRVNVGSSPSPNSNEEEDLANCLMMLSNGAVDSPEMEVEAEESCASASKELDHHNNRNYRNYRNNNNNNNNNNIMRKAINFIPPLSYRLPEDNVKAKGAVGPSSSPSPSKGTFECKACKKVFNSHQALGGHRASHKKVKGCFAARLEQMEANDDVLVDQESLFFGTNNKSNNSSNSNYENGLPSTSKRKSKVHECSICHRIFSSGQALGGHKRCHWITSSSNPAPDIHQPPPTTTSISNIIHHHHHQFHDHTPRPTPSLLLPLDLKLDLNLPAPSDDHRRPPFQVSTEIYLQSSWVCKSDKKHQNDSQQPPPNSGLLNNQDEQNNPNNVKTIDDNNNNSHHHVDDEADSKVLKLPKLGDLKDVNMSSEGNSSPWLQVGIASTTTDVRPDP